MDIADAGHLLCKTVDTVMRCMWQTERLKKYMDEKLAANAKLVEDIQKAGREQRKALEQQAAQLQSDIRRSDLPHSSTSLPRLRHPANLPDLASSRVLPDFSTHCANTQPKQSDEFPHDIIIMILEWVLVLGWVGGGPKAFTPLRSALPGCKLSVALMRVLVRRRMGS